jgi:hypothetical protein
MDDYGVILHASIFAQPLISARYAVLGFEPTTRSYLRPQRRRSRRRASSRYSASATIGIETHEQDRVCGAIRKRLDRSAARKQQSRSGFRDPERRSGGSQGDREEECVRPSCNSRKGRSPDRSGSAWPPEDSEVTRQEQPRLEEHPASGFANRPGPARFGLKTDSARTTTRQSRFHQLPL